MKSKDEKTKETVKELQALQEKAKDINPKLSESINQKKEQIGKTICK